MCWLLGILFRSEFAEHIVFKGGTSLSKVFGAIARFSEDIDLSVSPQFLKLKQAGSSRSQAHKWMAKAELACGQAVASQIKPNLEQHVLSVLGKRNTDWFEFLTDPSTHSPVLLFHYPSIQPAGFEYLKRSVTFGLFVYWLQTQNIPIPRWLAIMVRAGYFGYKISAGAEVCFNLETGDLSMDFNVKGTAVVGGRFKSVGSLCDI